VIRLGARKLKQPIPGVRRAAAGLCLLWASLATAATAQELILRCDPAQTAADFTLGDALHTVKGTFNSNRDELRVDPESRRAPREACELRFDPTSGKVGGEIAFDATTGRSGNQSRDRKMHKEVLESARYPEIAFRPDRVDGKVLPGGTSTVQIHGMFAIHGAEHEITVPVEVKLEADRWSASAHFPVPYAKWGMKNPSVLFLRVGDSVDIELHAAGSLTAATQ
jgi:polyisoprenoid-binding protein YceI